MQAFKRVIPIKPLNLFYVEPDPDRWLKFDRYPRRVIRRLVRGKQRPGGVAMIAINLMKGLDRLGVPYRFNDYTYIKKHMSEIACVIGKPHLLFEKQWQNPIIFGAGIFSHPIEHPGLLLQYPNIRRLLVPGNWMKEMFEPYYHDKVETWPVGIDTEYWQPGNGEKKYDFLIYDKTHGQFDDSLLKTIITSLSDKGLTYNFITYGNYNQQQLKAALSVSKAAIFLSKSETQGLAYQQILATNTPVLAWDEGGYWMDPYYYPEKVKFKPVSSVPYWDERCGLKFTNESDFLQSLQLFQDNIAEFKPREFITDNLTLEKCAQKYLTIYQQVLKELA